MKNSGNCSYTQIIWNITLLITFLTLHVTFNNNQAFALTINLPAGYYSGEYITGIDVQSMAFSPDGTLYVNTTAQFKCRQPQKNRLCCNSTGRSISGTVLRFIHPADSKVVFTATDELCPVFETSD